MSDPKLESLEDDVIDAALYLDGLCSQIAAEWHTTPDHALLLLQATNLLPGLLELWGSADGSPSPDPLTPKTLV